MLKVRLFTFSCVVALLAAGVPSGDTASAQTPGAAREARVRRLGSQITTITKLPRLEPAAVARLLGARLGPGKRNVSNEMVIHAPLERTDLIAGGEITTARQEAYVEVTPAPDLKLNLRDFEPLLLDYPHHQEVLRSHVGADWGSMLLNIVYVFDVKVGALLVYVHPPERAGGAEGVVDKILIKNEHIPWSLGKTTLRADRAKQRRPR
jgi:hypothetical protein